MEATKAAQRNPSRNLVIALVILLIVVAIAGIVLAGRRTAAPKQGTAAAVPDAPATATQQIAIAPTAAPVDSMNEVVFAAGSDRLPPTSSESIAKFSDAARGVGGQIRLSARFLTGANKVRDLELARARTAAVRHALQANGVKAEKLQVEMVEMPPGALTDRDANRVELSMR